MPGVEHQHTAARSARLSAITPDQIERRPFAIEDRGYDRDEVRKFLAEVAATLRLAQRSTVPPLLMPTPSGPGGADATSTLDRVPAEVTRILRAAELSAQHRRDEADAFVTAILERARDDAEQTRQQAADDAALETDRARRVLLSAQEQATTIVDEAERRAAAMLDAARDHARQHARRIAGEAQRRADEVSDAEAAALLRLNEARLDLVNVIDALAGTRTHAVLDITGAEAEVHLESLPVTVEHDRAGGAHGDRDALDGERSVVDRSPVLELVEDDETPAQALVRRAVERATAAATADPQPDLDAAGAAQVRVAPVRQSVKRRQAHKGDARPCPTAVAPAPTPGRATPARRTDS